jgi:arylsulfatase A-like enzyme
MNDRRPRSAITVGLGALAGGVAGAGIGLADGVRAGLLVGARLPTVLTAAALAAAGDALIGLLAGAAAEAVVRAATWGRRAATPTWARAVAFAMAGLGAAAATAATVAVTAARHNRFLAAGLTVLAGAGAALAGLVLAPVLARLLAGRRARPVEAQLPSVAAVVLGPVPFALFAVVVLFTVGHTRRLPAGGALTQLAAQAAAAAFLLPWAAAWVGTRRMPFSRRVGGALAAAVYGGAAVAVLAVTWESDLRFAPWTDILVGATIAALAAVLVWRLRPAALATGGRTAAACGVVLALAAAVLFRASESEPARKAVTRAGLASALLDTGRRALDFDGDGYARALGGGDCDDRDPDVHPGALDLPGDGIDSDCDGQDATDSVPAPPTMAALPPAVPRDLNLILVTIDTLRADHLGCYGYPRPTSPAIDALAADGALFENGWAHAPSTRYSMPAIASGRWPSAITWDESIWWPRLAPAVRTTAQALHELGYFNAGMFSFSYFAIGDHRGFERGMDLYRSDRAVLHVAVNGPMESRGSSSREMTDDAIAFVDEHTTGRFFLWLHYYDPHLGYERHAEVPDFGSARVDLYDGEIRFTDLHFGRLLAHLRESGLWDRTALILTGDHGEGFGEHGVTEHGFDLYTAQTKVPFIVRVPGLPARRVRAPAGHIDIGPTLLNLAGGDDAAAARSGFLGRSLVPDLAGPPAADTESRAVFQEVTSERGKKRALVTATRHLIWNAEPGDTTECYDRGADPAEAHDIWDPSGDPACVGLSRAVKRLVAGLALPRGAVEKLARAVTPPGVNGPAPTHPLDASLGPAIGVRGYDISAETVRAGTSVEVTTYFLAKTKPDPKWHLFFHLEGPHGFRNLDHVPAEGLMPLERWHAGQQIRDRLEIPIAPDAAPGRYTLYLGGFRKGERLAVTPAALSDGANRLRVLTFEVTPSSPTR